MTVVTRFAPSPTGFLHIGGARTALFNWLYAKNKGGKFLLRIEDTDRKRSTDEAIEAILSGMKWLGINWDDDVVYQFKGVERHKQIAQELLDNDKAYKCYCSKEELDAMRAKAQESNQFFKYDGRCRNRKDLSNAVAPVVRLKAPNVGFTKIDDAVQGKVTVQNTEQDDMILLRSDGTPTYMLAVVVDDHDMGVTHIIRGDDHLTNATRQKLIYDALGWEVPVFAHIPLINGPDGAKMSKRHGALGVEAYRDMGYLPEALRNYLLRLGWSHGDDEIISTQQAINWFNLESLGKSPSRFDYNKLDNVNAHYIKEADDRYLVDLIKPLIEFKYNITLDQLSVNRLLNGMAGLKQRVKKIIELADSALFYINEICLENTDKAQKIIDSEKDELLPLIYKSLSQLDDWQVSSVENNMKIFCADNSISLGRAMGVIRAVITKSHISPSMFEVLAVIGKEEALSRLAKI